LNAAINTSNPAPRNESTVAASRRTAGGVKAKIIQYELSRRAVTPTRAPHTVEE
jgi:hypothetical protein